MGNTALYSLESEEYELLFRQYYESLCHYANMILKDMDAAEEVVQKTFVKLWEKKSNLSIETSIKSYLYKSVYHASLNELKHIAVKNKYISMQNQEEPVNEMQNSANVIELENRIEKALLNLPQQCRLIFQMSRFRHLKYREIADILNISIKTVENQMGKALKLMRTNLADYLSIVLLILHSILQIKSW
jgi:RNA polymerase sigma-70 factor (ECF subfamily)